MTDTSRQTAFVRTEFKAAEPPPRGQTGAVKWLMENLFSSVTNVILTLLSLWVIWLALASLVPWLWNSVWVAGSLTECRAIRDETVGPGASSGCFAVITERWTQLLFGFYPSSGYWRPILSLLIFLLAAWPVMFENGPKKLLWLVPVAPFVIFWLIWGGSVWPTVAAALGFVLGYLAFRFLGPVNALLSVIAAILVPVLYWLFLSGPLGNALAGAIPVELPAVASRDIGGFSLSLIIGLSAICLSLPLGILLALGRQSDMLIIRVSCTVFIEVIRGVPLIVWLFTAQLLLNYFLPRGTNFDLMLRVIIMVTLFSSAYMAEVIRGGLAALPKGQFEAGDALGLNYWQSMRLIILPQALKISIPGIVNTFIGLFKDTTLVTFIGMYDPMGFAKAIRTDQSWNGIYWEIYFFIAVMFFIFCFAMSRYSMYLERKLQREHR
jgi:general L-amino acid transport system permease protein